MTETNERVFAAGAKIFPAIIGAKRKVGTVGKNGAVKEYGNYDYRKFDDVLNAVAPVLDEFGIIIVPNVEKYEERQDGKKHFVVVTMTYRLYAEDGSYIVGSAIGESFDVGDKAATKAQTVALRILYCTTFNIAYDEMQDPESGEQGAWREPNQTTYNRLIGTLGTLQDSRNLNGILNSALKCLNATQENGDHLSSEQLRKSSEAFSSAARRLRFSEKAVAQIVERIESKIQGKKQPTESSQISVEPARYKELTMDFGLADTVEKRERVLLTLLQSYRTGHVSHEEVGNLVSEFCPETDKHGQASFLLCALYNSGTPAEIAGMANAVHQAGMDKHIGKDIENALSTYAQNLIDRTGIKDVD